MKKNMIIFATGLVALLVILAFVVNYQNSKKSEDNPYGKSNLEQSTIDQLDDPNYQNQIQPDALKERIQSGKETTVYFYDPECPHCKRTTPIVVPMAQELGVDLKKMNLREFDSPWNEYGIEATPTIVHFENGEEEARIKGENPVNVFDEFFHQKVLEDSPQQDQE